MSLRVNFQDHPAVSGQAGLSLITNFQDKVDCRRSGCCRGIELENRGSIALPLEIPVVDSERERTSFPVGIPVKRELITIRVGSSTGIQNDRCAWSEQGYLSVPGFLVNTSHCLAGTHS